MMLRKVNLAIKQDLAEEEAIRRDIRKNGFPLQDHRRLLHLAAVRRTIRSVPASLGEQADELAERDKDWVEHSLICLRYYLGSSFFPEDATTFIQTLIERTQDTDAQAEFHVWQARQDEMDRELAFGEPQNPREYR